MTKGSSTYSSHIVLPEQLVKCILAGTQEQVGRRDSHCKECVAYGGRRFLTEHEKCYTRGINKCFWSLEERQYSSILKSSLCYFARQAVLRDS